MKEILHISLDSSINNQTYEINAFGQLFKIIRLGTEGDFNLLKDFIVKYEKTVSAIAISGLPNTIKVGDRNVEHAYLTEIKALSFETPIVDGQRLRELYIPWVIQSNRKQSKELFDYKKIGFFSAAIQYNYLDSFFFKNNELLFADPHFYFKAPLLLRSKNALENFLKLSYYPLTNVKIGMMQKRNFFRDKLVSNYFLRDFANVDIYVSNITQLSIINTDLYIGKTLVTDSISAQYAEELLNKGVQKIISFEPKIDNQNINFTLLEAILISLKDTNEKLEFDEIKDYIDEFNLIPKFNIYESSTVVKSKNKFAFLIHPLKKSDFLKFPGMSVLKTIPKVSTALENLASYVPGFHYGTIKGIKSEASNCEIEGDLYMVTKTPKKLLKENPEKFYSAVKIITQVAKERGASIFGLGAYTKIVGDAGISISERSPIPVTTGNSLSAASTLWAANYSIGKMDLVRIENGIFQGKVMVIGATGSIGKVTAKLLAQKWLEIILIAPKGYKLMELASEIKVINQSAKVVVHTDCTKFLDSVDLIISTTSSTSDTLFDISSVKPGAVICDVSRPFNISESAAITRPDVLVIASGEVELPGNVVVDKPIGLHGNVVYACLAETALLALEGRFESFSLSRDLDYKKVVIIDQLARKHGVKLAAIMGHTHEITEEEIMLCRKKALEKIEAKANVHNVCK